MKRYIARYAGKDGFEERYEVIDTNTGESISPRLPYHTANDQAELRNGGETDERKLPGGCLHDATAASLALAMLEKLTAPLDAALADLAVRGEAEFCGMRIVAVPELGDHAYRWAYPSEPDNG